MLLRLLFGPERAQDHRVTFLGRAGKCQSETNEPGIKPAFRFSFSPGKRASGHRQPAVISLGHGKRTCCTFQNRIIRRILYPQTQLGQADWHFLVKFKGGKGWKALKISL